MEAVPAGTRAWGKGDHGTILEVARKMPDKGPARGRPAVHVLRPHDDADRGGAVTALSALCHPQVLWAAWLRVDGWYRSGNVAPQPELARWRLHPERELRRLRDELLNAEWKPTQWAQVPYPKKGACLRHYVMPSVQDQVAFMAYMVLLAPLLDYHFEPFSFGNRWYRPMFWNRRSSRHRWCHLPYPLLTSRTYRPYAQSFGLFRRVAHWAVARMTDAPIANSDRATNVRQPEDYSNKMLPPWTQSDWWKTSTRREACWVALDLQMAYPSVCHRHLRERMLALLSSDVSVDTLDSFGGYPSSVLNSLAAKCERIILGENLMSALSQITGPRIHRDAWKPFHGLQKLPPDKDIGIPTGLAISGMLLNVILDSTDKSLCRFWKSSAKERGAAVRFADDIYLLSSTYDGLFTLTEEFWRSLSGDTAASLATPSSTTNLYLNLTKVRPEAVRKTILKFLGTQGWSPCNDHDQGCGELKPPPGDREYVSLAQWWASERTEPLPRPLERATIRDTDLGPFVTTLVERLSEINTDTLADRFGDRAADRLARLHELARFDIDDEQVRTDTRRTFSVNRLVHAWLPSSSENDAIKEIRSSIGYVLQLTPWKHSLWRSVVRASARRPLGTRSADQTDDDSAAKEWLKRQLRRVASGEPSPGKWAHTWPEECADSGHERGGDWLSLYLSCHRAAFWHALSETLRDLWRHDHRSARTEYTALSPTWWISRSVPEGGHRRIIKFLGAVDDWAAVLYGKSPRGDAAITPGELDQMCAAVLAACRRSDVAAALLSCEEPNHIFSVPRGIARLGCRTMIELLAANNRTLPMLEEDRTFLGTWSLAYIALAGVDERLGKLLFPDGRRSLVKAVEAEPGHAVAAGISLDCTDALATSLLNEVIGPSVDAQAVADDPMVLSEYHKARRIMMGRARGVM